MKVYLIRHAQSEENMLDLRSRTSATLYNQVVRDSPASPLTEQGREQARQLLAKFSQIQLERLYASPFARALTTAQILGEAVGLAPQIVDDLREVIPPELSERLRDRTLRHFFVRSYLTMAWPWSAGETWGRAYQRAQVVWRQLTDDQSGTIAVVSHRGFISLMLLSLRRDRRWQIMSRDLSNGGVSLLVRAS
jgi:broad specificity phosphatase PhoE